MLYLSKKQLHCNLKLFFFFWIYYNNIFLIIDENYKKTHSQLIFLIFIFLQQRGTEAARTELPYIPPIKSINSCIWTQKDSASPLSYRLNYPSSYPRAQLSNLYAGYHCLSPTQRYYSRGLPFTLSLLFLL